MTGAAAISFASGKGHRDENFPVASRLVSARYRGPILAFYRFARLADDVADHPSASPAEKLARLNALEASLIGRSDTEPAAAALRGALTERNLGAHHALDLLAAFRRDTLKHRYASWSELIDYCSLSAMPVGRFVLDVHGEDRSTWRYSDPLCAALQIINHLQDCGDDYRMMDRVYLPQDVMAAAGASADDLGRTQSTAELRAVIVEIAGRARRLLDEAAPFALAIRDRRLSAEVAIIHGLAMDLVRRLHDRDPLADKVRHHKAEAALIALRALFARLVSR